MTIPASLIPASFRGAAFKVESYGEHSGRRLAKFEFPQRDDGYVEDLGQRLTDYAVRGYVVGDTYDFDRDALRAALKADGPGTLVHPYLGELQVFVDTYSLAERLTEQRLATFDIAFVDAGQQPSPISFTDTASTLLGYLDTAAAVLEGNYAAVLPYLPGDVLLPGIAVATIGSALLGLAATLQSGLAGLGSAALGPLLPLFGAMSATPTDPAATATAVTAAFAAAATAATAIANPPLVAYSPVLGDTSALSPPPDPSYGLAAFATWVPPGVAGAAGTPAAAGTPLAATQTALTGLVQGAAVMAVATVYANTDFLTANAAQAAGTQLVQMLDTLATTAADAGDNTMLRAWTALETAAQQDLTARVLNLPLLGTYSVGTSLPSLVLAQRLYSDPRRADELVALNGAIHPLFMPATGLALTQ